MVKTVVMTDVYYDDDQYSLTTKDIWLRKRDNKLELKLPLNAKNLSERLADNYQELEDESEIKSALGVESLDVFQPFATIVTKRLKYRRDKFGIDVDKMDFGYTLAEIELMTESREEMPAAQRKILEFADKLGLKYGGQARGKVIEYLRRFDPKHLQALMTAGVISA